MELEIWPNFLQAARKRDIPVAVINGRISERTFKGYRMARSLLPQLDLISRYCVQDQAYQRRLLDLGVDPARIFVTGNMKYDSVDMGQHAAESGAKELHTHTHTPKIATPRCRWTSVRSDSPYPYA